MMPPSDDLSAEVMKTIRVLKYSFFNAYEFQQEWLWELVQLLQEADSRGVIVEDAVELADTSYWLQWITANLTYLDLLLRFAKNPCPKNLRASGGERKARHRDFPAPNSRLPKAPRWPGTASMTGWQDGG